MKTFIVFSAMVALAMGVSYYTTGDDHLDVDKMMADPAKVKSYMDCYLDRAPCDALAQSYKVILEDSLATACKRCNDDQKRLWNRFLWNLYFHYPVYFSAFEQKYDPKKIYIPELIHVVGSY